MLARVFSKKYGHDNYLKVSNFDISVKKWEKKTSAQKIGEISDLISKLQHEIARQLSKNNPTISHYMLEYGYVPLWVLVNTLTLGTISTFYSYLSEKEQNEIGRYFSLKPAEMNSFLQLLTIFRNACAHDERLYNLRALRRNMKPNYIKTLPIHREMKIPVDNSNNPICGKNDLFAVTIIFKTMLPKSTFNKFFYAQRRLLDDLEKMLSVIDVRVVEKSMGFPENWQKIREL